MLFTAENVTRDQAGRDALSGATMTLSMEGLVDGARKVVRDN